MRFLLLLILVLALNSCSNNNSHYGIKCYDNGVVVLDEKVKDIMVYNDGRLLVFRFDRSSFMLSSGMKCVYSKIRIEK